MELTVLGNNGPFPAAGGACSGYLLKTATKNILIDCGNGVLSNLQKYVSFLNLDAIILSHLHSDHMSDIMVFRYAVSICMSKFMTNKLIDIYAPDSPNEEYNRLNIKGIFNLHTITDDLVLNFDEMSTSFCEMKHPFKNYAMAFVQNNKKFVYSGDTSINDRLVEFSKNSDLLMLDSGLLNKDKTNENVVHMTSRECGIVASKSNSKKLLLTHFMPYNNIEDCINEAKENFNNVEATKLFNTYNI